jgi:hypothetical protein
MLNIKVFHRVVFRDYETILVVRTEWEKRHPRKMSSIWTLSRMYPYLEANCPDFEPVTGAWFLILMDYYPFLLNVGMWSVSMYRKEKYLQLVSFMLLVDTIVNTGLKYTIRQPPTYDKCGETYEMPSFAAQQSVVFAVSMVALTSLWNCEMTLFKSILLSLSTLLPCIARIFIGESSALQVCVGGMVGFVEAVVILFFVRAYLWDKLRYLDRFRLIRWFGLEDLLCNDKKTVTESIRERYRLHGYEGLFVYGKNK